MSNTFQLQPTLCFTLLGTFIIYAWTRQSRTSLLASLIVALGLRFALIRAMGTLGTYWGVRWISWGAFLGIGCLLVLFVQILRARAVGERKSLRAIFYAGAVFPGCSMLIAYTVPLTIWFRHLTYDAFLLAFDGSLGVQPSFLMGRLLPSRSNYWGLTTVVYYALPAAVSIVYASHLAAEREGKRRVVSILPLFLSLMAAGAVMYAIYPAIGPALAFPKLFPWNPPALSQITIQPMTVRDFARNCMPSLHLSGALGVWWNSRLWARWGRMLAGLFLCGTVFATLALGEHYLIDLVVAVPFMMALQAAWTVGVPFAESRRRRALIVGTVLTALWIVLLRFGLSLFFVTPVIPWSLVALTVSWSFVLEWQLSAFASKSTYSS
ncbi:MAG: phosphatase PAP2 family protein [Terriglobales bacterium]